jgi:hypothetical protein
MNHLKALVPRQINFFTWPSLRAAPAARSEAKQYRVLCTKKTQTRRVFKKGTPIELASLIVSLFRLQSTNRFSLRLCQFANTDSLFPSWPPPLSYLETIWPLSSSASAGAFRKNRGFRNLHRSALLVFAPPS